MRQSLSHRARIAAIAAALSSVTLSASGQTGQALSAAVQAQAAQAATTMDTVKRLSIDEAHRRDIVLLEILASDERASVGRIKTVGFDRGDHHLGTEWWRYVVAFGKRVRRGRRRGG